MKHPLFPLVLSSFVFLSACVPQPCAEVTCLNGGTCDSGDCVCPDGYEGPNCETEQRLAFVGSYAVSEACVQGNFAYSISIEATSANGTEITIQNFSDFNLSVTALVNGSTLTIPTQIMTGSTISGSGEMVNDVLMIDYTLATSGGQTLVCTMACTAN
jgi:hypothetical protein